MKFKDLYEKGLERKVNPAVSASDLSEDTVRTEITEYVFTTEIIANLYNILLNIKNNQGNHIGIWINGYFGSGKSHFLKYVSYCLSSKYADIAFTRLINAAREILDSDEDDLALEQAGVNIGNLEAMKKWYVEKAKVEIIMFNIGDVHNAQANQATTFTTIFWNQFNAMRGYNSLNLALAQYLEKALDEDGKFEEFKEYMSSKGYDWEHRISLFAAARLDMALEMAEAVDPDLAIDAIRERIIKNDINVSVEAFTAELNEYLDKKDDKNCRILFLVDEVSQFIGEHRDLLLQLQSIVKRLCDDCGSRVWVACTAQQKLDNVVATVGDPNDEIGKILGRFEVRASLQGTSPEYITQRRILDKKANANVELTKMFKENKGKIDAQFNLPTTYQSYKDAEDFANYYPFVPYQFHLIMKVLDSFEQLNYVDKQVKGNERSLLNITFSIAKETGEWEVGKFVPFDSFFGAMVQGSMQHSGQRAIENARSAVNVAPQDKQPFYRRVVNVLFMICNLSEGDKQGFSATIDNIVTLLMTEVDANKAVIKNDVAQALSYLMDKSVIRKIKTDNDSEIYDFYTEEEAKVAEIIKGMNVDGNTYSEELRKIIFDYFNISTNKEPYATRTFSVSVNVDGRSYLANNADIVVDFLASPNKVGGNNAAQYAFHNQRTHLAFLLSFQLSGNSELRQNFLYYCRVQKFAQEAAISEERQKTKRLFLDRAKDLYDKEIKKEFHQILDTCSVVSGQNILTQVQLGTLRKQERYKKAIQFHLGELYEYAKLVDYPEIPRNTNDLTTKILRPIEDTLVERPLSLAETKMRDYLARQQHDVNVADVVRDFAKIPYGWSELASIYILNELVRRHLYAYNYNNDPNVSRETTAHYIVKEAAKFTIEEAKVISQDVINKFIEAWKHIFNVVSINGSNDPTELFRNCKEKEDSALNVLLKNYRALSKKLAKCPCVSVIDEAISLMEDWSKIRDPKAFFETITSSRDEAAVLFDQCKVINTFANGQYDKYERVLRFIDDNKDNFSFLPEDQIPAVKQIKAIQDDMRPWENLPACLKLMQKLDANLKTCKEDLTKTIADNYNKVFDELEEYAKSVNFPLEKHVRRESTIPTKTNSNNFYALKANADTSSFYEEITQLINSAVVNDGDESTYGHRKVISLNTHTATPIRTENDVDIYLKGLKAEIMQYIGSGNDIIIN